MKIKSKRIINLEEKIPVYDITVPYTHNFALANGIIVHNSKDVMDGIVGSYWACKTVKPAGGIITIVNTADDTNFKKRLKEIKKMVVPNSPEAQQIDPEILINFMRS